MRTIFHVIISIAMWCLFGYYWHVVLGREISAGTLRALAFLGLTVLLGLLATMAWVGHNLRLARKFAGRRRSTPDVGDPMLAADSIGRSVEHPGLDQLREARIIDIDADGDAKRYSVAAPGRSA